MEILIIKRRQVARSPSFCCSAYWLVNSLVMESPLLLSISCWSVTWMTSFYSACVAIVFSIKIFSIKIFTITAEFTRAHWLILSICGQTHEFEIHATRQRARVGNSTICYRKKHIDDSFYASVILLTMNFVITLSGKVVCGSTIHRYFENVMTKFMINNRTDA